MNELPRFYKARLLAYECWLWAKTEWRFHFWLGIGALILSVGWALYSRNPLIFARSGAVMIIAGTMMTYRGYFRGSQNAYWRDTGIADRRAFSRWHPFKSKDRAKAEDRAALRAGIVFLVVGSLIWAYGDVLLPLKKLSDAQPVTPVAAAQN